MRVVASKSTRNSERIHEMASSKGYQVIKHCAEAIISCNGAQQDTTANLEDDSDWSNVTDVAKLWMSNKKKEVSIRIRYI